MFEGFSGLNRHVPPQTFADTGGRSNVMPGSTPDACAVARGVVTWLLSRTVTTVIALLGSVVDAYRHYLEPFIHWPRRTSTQS